MGGWIGWRVDKWASGSAGRPAGNGSRERHLERRFRMTAGSSKTCWIAVGIVLLLGVALPIAVAQQGSPAPAERGAVLLVSSSAGAETSLAATALPASAHPGSEIIREIDDPSSGQRWLLVRDDSHPGGTGLLLPMDARRDRTESGPITAPGAAAAPAQDDLPMIRSGDHVEIEEHSVTVDARLEAVALMPAGRGSAFNARLAIGGQVVRAVAVAPGRAIFADRNEATR